MTCWRRWVIAADDLKRAQQAMPGLDLLKLWPTTSRWAQA